MYIYIYFVIKFISRGKINGNQIEIDFFLKNHKTSGYTRARETWYIQ